MTIKNKVRRSIFGLPAVLCAVTMLAMMPNSAVSADFGTRDEAQQLLERAVVVLNADKRRALDTFTSGIGGFLDRDLYVFCGGPDGMLTAHPYFLGSELKEFADDTGKAVGEEMYAIAKEGEFAEVTYKFARPGGDEQLLDKIAFISKVDDQVCGVGYYE
jgi:signal transduction histidine kinase